MSVLVFQDLFTEPTSNVNLTSHTPTVGTSWSLSEDTTGGTRTLRANAGTDTCSPSATATSVRVLYTANPTIALQSADYDVRFTVADLSAISGSNDDPAIMIARYVDNSNYYSAGQYQGLINTLKIYKKVAGVVTNLGSVGWTPALGAVITLELRGSNLTLTLDGVAVIGPVSDSAISSIGKGGLCYGNAWVSTDDISAANVMDIDDFRIVDQTSVISGVSRLAYLGAG